MAAVAVLVVTCPCALSLATPTAMLTTAGLLARQGVLVRRLQAIESLAGVDTVVFDKTGTLTEACMGLRQALTRDGLSPEAALTLAAALAKDSLHPVSRALCRAALVQSGPVLSVTPRVSGVSEQAGKGVSVLLLAPFMSACAGPIRLGSALYCGIHNVPESEQLQVFLADSAGWLASFELDEVLRPDAAQAVVQLQVAGLEVQMLSGDRSAAARRVARVLGIEQVQGDCTPESKLAWLQTLQRQGRRVLMVGDGLNDAPVLALADVSVAIGQAVPMAQAQSDFIIPGGQLSRLAHMPDLARRTLRIVRQNLVWAGAYNLVCVPLAIASYLPAWLAGLGMALSSLLVMANAARLTRAQESG
jgi:Cu2+-exporting ATPase